MRATAQDRDAAQQMGVDVNAVQPGRCSPSPPALGGVSGLLVGMYYNYIDPAMSFQATLKGVVAQVVGGVGNVPGAIVGSLLLGLIESYGIALFGTQLPQPLRLRPAGRRCWCWRPNGLFASTPRRLPPEPMTGTFIAPSKPIARAAAGAGRRSLVAALCCRWSIPHPYLLQTLTNSWLYALLGLSLTLIAGTVGQISLGHAALLAIGGYASALLALDLGVPVGLAILVGRPDHGAARHGRWSSRRSACAGTTSRSRPWRSARSCRW